MATAPTEIKVTPEIAAEHGLTREEYARVRQILGREPNITELGIFSVMWSEHCSYKSSKVHLERLPTRGKLVVQGPGENAGVVDIGDGLVAAFKIESHNHPSFVEPFQGATTGVGGILRDIFTMGARPIAVLDSLRFGEITPSRHTSNEEAARNRRILDGVIRGVGSYGNCFGVPTVGGEVAFEPCYSQNPLVNALALGIARKEDLFFAKAKGAGNPVIYVGAKTGRDGIHGASLLASAEFTEESQQKRPNVQVGDPFMEKLLLEACLEAMQTGAVVAIQDMGAAGLTCSTVEMASRGGTGIEIDLAKVPQRETAMTPYEIMLSESHAAGGGKRPRAGSARRFQKVGPRRRGGRACHRRRRGAHKDERQRRRGYSRTSAGRRRAGLPPADRAARAARGIGKRLVSLRTGSHKSHSEFLAAARFAHACFQALDHRAV